MDGGGGRRVAACHIVQDASGILAEGGGAGHGTLHIEIEQLRFQFEGAFEPVGGLAHTAQMSADGGVVVEKDSGWNGIGIVSTDCFPDLGQESLGLGILVLSQANHRQDFQ